VTKHNGTNHVVACPWSSKAWDIKLGHYLLLKCKIYIWLQKNIYFSSFAFTR